MLLKKGKYCILWFTGEGRKQAFLKRLKNSLYPNICEQCLFNNGDDCKDQDIDCTYFDTCNYSFILKWKGECEILD